MDELNYMTDKELIDGVEVLKAVKINLWDGMDAKKRITDFIDEFRRNEKDGK